MEEQPAKTKAMQKRINTDFDTPQLCE